MLLLLWIGAAACEGNTKKNQKKKKLRRNQENRNLKVKRLKNMGEEITQLENSAGANSIDETDRAAPKNIECLVEKCDRNVEDTFVPQPQSEVTDKSPKKSPSVSSTKDGNKKWYNISFMHRNSGNSRNNPSQTAIVNNKSSINIDNRHSWHLNDSVEM